VPTDPTRTLLLGRLEIDLDGHCAALEGRRLDLTALELQLLAYLVANRDRVVSRPELRDRLGLAGARTVDVMLCSLRRELGPGFVHNVRKRGWIVVPEALEDRTPAT
jgi:two-component system, OmpR family, response regulator